MLKFLIICQFYSNFNAVFSLFPVREPVNGFHIDRCQSYQNYHVMVGNTLVKLEEHNPKNKHIYAVGDNCSLVFDPKSVHVL